MPVDLDEVFRQLTPPPGGAEKLSSLLASRPRERRRWLPAVVVLAPAALAAALAVLLVGPAPAPMDLVPTIDAALNPAVARYQGPRGREAGSRNGSVSAIEPGRQAVNRVEGTPDDVIFYWVAAIGNGVVDAPGAN